MLRLERSLRPAHFISLFSKSPTAQWYRLGNLLFRPDAGLFILLRAPNSYVLQGGQSTHSVYARILVVQLSFRISLRNLVWFVRSIARGYERCHHMAGSTHIFLPDLEFGEPSIQNKTYTFCHEMGHPKDAS